MLAVAHSLVGDPIEAAAELAGQLGGEVSLVLFFASSAYDPEALAHALSEALPGCRVAGCSTMGELGPKGLSTGGVSAFGLGGPSRCALRLVHDTARFAFASVSALVEELAAELGVRRLEPGRHVLLTLTDGLCGAEERLVAALALAAPQVDIVGGSAGDDLKLEGTWVALDGVVHSSASLVLALEPNQPFTAFQVHHFDPTERRVVVTAADPDRRVLLELDGFPASEVMGELLGVHAADFDANPMLPSEREVSFANAVGGQMFMRSPMRVSGSELLMRGAVEEGVVLRVMRGGDLVERTRRGMAERVHPGARGALLFNCGGRLMEARAKGLEEPLYQAMSPLPVAGFSTYAEQFGALLVNHTLTGLALG